MTVTIYQIKITTQMYAEVNAGNEVPAYEAKRSMGFDADKYTPDMFELYTPVYTVDTDNLEDAFEFTNTWDRPDAITCLAERASSSSIGDIFELNGTKFICDMMGFKEIEVA
jgi:hypothetical protein